MGEHCQHGKKGRNGDKAKPADECVYKKSCQCKVGVHGVVLDVGKGNNGEAHDDKKEGGENGPHADLGEKDVLFGATGGDFIIDGSGFKIVTDVNWNENRKNHANNGGVHKEIAGGIDGKAALTE